MGQEVAGLSRRAEVALRPDPHDAFGVWFARERRLRGIPLEYVSLHTKLPMARLRALEGGCDPLGSDRGSRAAARALALAIGADPEEAAGRISDTLPAPPVAQAAPEPIAARFVFPRLALALALLLAAAGAAWGLLAFLEARAAPAPEVVFRPDYVERLRAVGGK